MRGLPFQLTFAAMVLASGAAHPQGATPLGTVATADAVVTGPAGKLVAVAGGRAEIGGMDTVTANPARNAEVRLTRGGSVLVCQTSSLHVAGSIAGPLLLALDRGAMEIRMKSAGDDSVMTPDLRFTMAGGGVLDLRLRVSFNGDTCVENRGNRAPTLRLTDAFGDTSYEVRPGQHVLFEHGSLREVVDRETTPCGCPPAEPSGVSLAEAALYGGKAPVSAKQAEGAHPFPAAVSEGLAAPSPIPPEQPAGGTHVQVATALSYDPAAPNPAGPNPTSTRGGDAKDQGSTQASPPEAHRSPIASFFRGIRRIFTGRHD